jgi:hypothetical protein
MRIRLDRDDFSLLLASEDVGDPRDGFQVVEIRAVEFAAYQRVRREFEEWQRRLEALSKTG